MNFQILKPVSVLVLWLGCLPFSVSAQGVQLVSTIAPAKGSSAGGSGDSYLPVISPDGRFVLFASTANNLVALDNGQPIPSLIPPPLNVFLRDRSNSTTVLVSMNVAGTGGADADVMPVGISADGRFALFESAADNLVAGDVNNASDIFVRDLVLGKTILVSIATDGRIGNGASQWSVMTADGRYVAFLSDASNLVAGDHNGIPDVFVRDLVNGVTELASVGATPSDLVTPLTLENPPAITPDGRFVLFHSTAANLVAGVTTTDDLYVRDRQLGTTVQASAGAVPAMQKVIGTSDVETFNYTLSTNGQYVVYEANPSFGPAALVLRYSLLTGLTELIHTNATSADQGVGSLDSTPDGGTIAFVGNADSSAGETTCVLVWNSHTGTQVLASGDQTNGIPQDSTCFWPTLDASGRLVAFLSNAAGLVTNNLFGGFHLYTRDLQTQTTTLVDADMTGAGSQLTSMPAPSLSANGLFVAFESADSQLVANDDNRAYDIFVRDLNSARTEIVSAHSPALPCLTPNGDSSLSPASVSANSQSVVFWSEADNLIENDTNQARDVFVHDLLANQNTLVSVSTNGQSADGISSDGVMSLDGRYVAFTSRADDLVSGDNNPDQDVFVRDLQTGISSLVSVIRNGSNFVFTGTYSLPSISTDGRFVLFTLSGGSFYLIDRQLGTNYTLIRNNPVNASMTPDGRFVAVAVSFSVSYGNLFVWDSENAKWVFTNQVDNISNVAISRDGQRVLYWTPTGLFAVDRGANTNWVVATNRPPTRYGQKFSADGRFFVYTALVGTSNQVYLYDFQTGANLLVSQQWASSLPANDSSDSPDLSPDGRFVAYRSQADNLVPGDTNGVPDIFLFDRLSGNTKLISASRFGAGPANNRSLNPVFSGDGQTLFFVSWASDLVSGDFNNASDVFAFPLYSTQVTAPFSATTTLDGHGFQMKWSALPGKAYQVQFKDDLNDPVWMDLNARLAIVGNAGYFTDSSGSFIHRFYRIVGY